MFAPVDHFEFDAEVWLYESAAAWHFITVPPDVSDEIDDATGDRKAGFGSVRVRVTIGSTTWTTSLFPDSKRGAYLLPVKKEVRRREDLAPGSRVAVVLTIRDI